MNVTTTSRRFRLNILDILKGLLIAVVTPAFTIIINTLDAGMITFNWHAIAITSLSSGLAYIFKNFFAPSQIKVAAHDSVVRDVKQGIAGVNICSVDKTHKNEQ